MARRRTNPTENKNLARYQELSRTVTLWDWIRCLLLFGLVSISALSSQLLLSPVYGAISSSSYHQTIQLVSWISAGIFIVTGPWVSSKTLGSMLPLHIWFTAPVYFYALTPLSAIAGPTYGPLFTEVSVLLPVVSITAYLILALLEGHFKLTDRGVTWVYPLVAIALGVASTRFEDVVQQVHFHALQKFPNYFIFTHSGLQLSLSIVYSCLYSSKFLLAVLPVILFHLQLNTTAPFPAQSTRLNATLSRHGYRLLARQESITGYISVLENTRDEFRVLRCDHSLLGGNWIPTPARRREGITVPEPIYPVFTMLEAVRLMQPLDTEADLESSDSSIQQALVIGLGIGTCSASLAKHGINTTVLELDPVVTAFARSHFDLPSNVTVIDGDAVSYVASAVQDLRAAHSTSGKYNYLIHDVFTGGAEPLALFTKEFLHSLPQLLKNHGTAAINYAGNLNDEATISVLQEVFEAFNSNCRVFREDEGTSKESKELGMDFTNIVTFCMKDKGRNAGVAWKFREVRDEDFLSSVSRRQNLPPRYEVDFEALLDGAKNSGGTVRSGRDMQQRQRKSAEDHWRIMRTVLPNTVWERW